jgi:CRP-like cAMP-binding protein
VVWSNLFRARDRAEQARLSHALRSVPLFRDVAAADLAAIWRRLRVVPIPAGGVICRRGEPGDRFYVIQSGALEVRLGLDPAGLPVRRLLPGDFVGELALLTGAPRSADVVALDDAVLWVLDRADLEALLERSPALARAFNRHLAERVAVMTRILEERELGLGRGPIGLRIGPYRVTAQLGYGGTCAVYSAVHVESEQAVALKVLPLAWAASPELLERLRREADALRNVEHPNVVKLHDLGEVDPRTGGLYLALEWLPNGLDRVLRAQFPEPLPVPTALRIACGAARGLAAVHASGLIHRDVKPSNVMLRADGTPVLVDFGIATHLAAVASDLRLTPTNVVVGTADYASPEQAAGAPLDGRSDLYALGVVLYEMLAGQVPFAGRDPLDTLRAHLNEPPPALPDRVPRPVRSIVERALQKRPEDRFGSALEMEQAIQSELAD